MEMKRISHFDVLEQAPIGSSHERVFEVTAKLQLEADKQVERENMEALFEEIETYSGCYVDARFYKSIFWQALKRKYLGRGD